MSNSRIRVRLSKREERLASDVNTVVVGRLALPVRSNFRLETDHQPVMEWNVHLKGALEPPNWLGIASAWNELLNKELRPIKRRHGASHPGTRDFVLDISFVTKTECTDLVSRQLTLNWAGIRLLSLVLDRVCNQIRASSLESWCASDTRAALSPSCWPLVPYDFR